MSHQTGPLTIDASIETFALRENFTIAGQTYHELVTLRVELRRNGRTGLGEAAGVDYLGDTAQVGLRAIKSIRPLVEAGITRDALRVALPAGGARNALDCALWDLEAQEAGQSVWRLAGLARPRPLQTTWTIGAGTPERMARTAASYANIDRLKLKLMGDGEDAHRVLAVRDARPNVWLAVDANRGLSRDGLLALLPILQQAEVRLIEQPFALGKDYELGRVPHVIPIAADESVQGLADLDRAVGLFDVVNIKLDKCGGLTEGLAMAARARALGLGVMVGNMLGTSRAMAPAYLVGQGCDVVDLDGPIFLACDRAEAVRYVNGEIHCPDCVWGSSGMLQE